MTVSCKLNAAEMRDAFRLNLTPSFWVKAALGNIRTLIYVGVLIAIVVTKGRSADWQEVAVLGGWSSSS